MTRPESVSKDSLGPDESTSYPGNLARRPIRFAQDSLPTELARGRRLFYSADNPTMAAQGAGVSCSTCHFDGRADGLTWRFGADERQRQTPSLAGLVSLTAPPHLD